jgi:hypothetical protein
LIHIDGLHRAYRDVTHCLISIRELRHLFEPSYFSSDEIEPADRPKWLAHFVGALANAHGHAKEMCELLCTEFAKAAGGPVVLCGVQADSLHAAVVELGTRMLEHVHESWDGDANASLLPPVTMYKLAEAFRSIDPAELWSHSRLEQEYLAARKVKPKGRGPRTRGELAADLLSELRQYRTQSLPSALLENVAFSFNEGDNPPPVYYESHEGRLDETWLWRVFGPFRSCRIDREAAERFNAAAARANETKRALDSLQCGPSAVTPPELLGEARASHQAALRELYESLLHAVLPSGDKETATPLAPVEYDENECRRLGLSREHMPLSLSEDHGHGPGHVHFTPGSGWSWGASLLPEVPSDDLQQAHLDVMQVAANMPGAWLTEGFYLSGSDTDQRSMHDPAHITHMIESLGYAYWRAKYRMVVVGREFAESAGGPVALSSSCPEATGDSAHAAVVRIAELLLSRVQNAIAASTTGDYINQDNYYTVVEAFQWSVLRDFEDSPCGGHWNHRGLVDEYERAARRRRGEPESGHETESRLLVAEPAYSFEEPTTFFWDDRGPIELPSLQFKLLKHMLAHRTSTIQGLADVVWGRDATETRDAAVRDTVNRLDSRLVAAEIPVSIVIEREYVVLTIRSH